MRWGSETGVRLYELCIGESQEAVSRLALGDSLQLQEVGCLFCLLYDIRWAFPHMGNMCPKETQVASCSTSWADRKAGANPAPMLWRQTPAAHTSPVSAAKHVRVSQTRPVK